MPWKLLSNFLAYERDKNESFRCQKTVDSNRIQLDLLADVARVREDDAILKAPGVTSSLDLCRVDGGEDLHDHVNHKGNRRAKARPPLSVGFFCG
jgi:hypothetical protein